MVKAGKTLGNFFRAGAFFLASALIPACTSCEKENFPPVAGIEVSPKSGEIPLEVRVKVTGTDVDGVGDIKSYNLFVNNEKIKRSYPIDTTITFTESGIVNVYGQVVDSKNQSDMTETNSIEVYGKHFIDQSASLTDDVNIKYDATLFRVPEAELKIKKDGTDFITKKITDVNQTGKDYEKTFTSSDGLTKGDYEFTLKSEDLEKKSSVNIPNYKPTVSQTSPVNFDEETDTTALLKSDFKDKNLEDISNINYTKVTSIDGKTKATLLPGNKLKIEGLPNQTGAYQIEIEFGSETGGLEKTVLTGNIIEDKRIEINPFVQPNDSTLNWYGSGDVDNNNIVNSQDATKITELINGTYSNPSDLRLKDRADVNGDGVVNNQDKQLLENKLNGIIPYLPGEWNKLQTRAEREDWLKKMLKIDEVSEISPFPGWDCTQYATQTFINFHGVGNPTDITRFLEAYPYDFSKNGRFNLPLYKLSIIEFDLNDKIISGHAMNTIALGNNILNWNDLCNVEPQFNQINVQPGEAYLIGINSSLYIKGTPTKLKVGEDVNLSEFIKYLIKNKILSDGIILNNPNLKIITQR